MLKDAQVQGETTTADWLLSRGLLSHTALVDAAEKSIDVERRFVDVIASTDAVDGHREIVRQNFRLERYLANPVVIWDHNRPFHGSDTEPLGRSENVRVEDVTGGRALKARLVFATADINPRAERVLLSFNGGFLRAVSIGFRPGDVFVEIRDEREFVVLDNNELFEISPTAVPSNPETLSERSLHARRAYLMQRALDTGHGKLRLEVERHINAQLEKSMGVLDRYRAAPETPERPYELSGGTPQSTPPLRGKDTVVEEIEILKKQLTEAHQKAAAAEAQSKLDKASLQTAEAELSTEREKSARLERERDAAVTESEQRKTLLDAEAKRADSAVAERDELLAKSVDSTIASLLADGRLRADEVDNLKALAPANRKLYDEQIARVEKRAPSAILNQNAIPDADSGGNLPVTGGEGGADTEQKSDDSALINYALDRRDKAAGVIH